MCMTNEAAAIKLAERDNLVGELVRELENRVYSAEESAFDAWQDRVMPAGDVDQVMRQWRNSRDYADFSSEWKTANAMIAKAREGAQS